MAAKDTLKKYADALNAHDLDALLELLAPDAEVQDPGVAEPIKGKEAIRQNLGSWLKAFPDMKFEVVEPVLSEGNDVLFQGRISGTHTGDLTTPQGTVAPTNKKFQFAGAGFWRLNSQGLVSEERRYYDTAALRDQLGLES